MKGGEFMGLCNGATLMITGGTGSFGNAVLHVPASWKVKINGDTAFSRIEEIGQCNPEGENVLEVIGNVSFGALQIKYIKNI